MGWLTVVGHAEESKILTSPPLTEYVATWPDGLSHKVTSKPPLIFKDWDRPYANAAGKKIMMQINAWFKEGTAAGLSQDTFRSFDNNHSKIPAIYPQIAIEDPVMDYQPATEVVFGKRVTFGVQSLGLHQSPFGEPMSIPEYHDRCQILAALDAAHLDRKTGATLPALDTALYRAFYETNCVFIGPAVWNYKIQGNGQHFDNLSFLTPFYLRSVGASGSDAYLMKPILYAAAALPPELKTRMLRTGTYTPTLLGLFKSQLGGDLRSPSAHQSAFKLPVEADEKERIDKAPFLEGLVHRAHGLTHIPPVTRMTMSKLSWVFPDGDSEKVYLKNHGYLITAALQEGQALQLEVDLSESWMDAGKAMKSHFAAILREPESGATAEEELKRLLVKYTERHPSVIQLRERIAEAKGHRSTLTKVDGAKGRYRLRVAWQRAASAESLKRTDVVFLANDGTFDGAPAYISIRHLQTTDGWLRR